MLFTGYGSRVEPLPYCERRPLSLPRLQSHHAFFEHVAFSRCATTAPGRHPWPLSTGHLPSLTSRARTRRVSTSGSTPAPRRSVPIGLKSSAFVDNLHDWFEGLRAPIRSHASISYEPYLQNRQGRDRILAGRTILRS